MSVVKKQTTIGFIGAGNMPASIIGGMVKAGFDATSIWASNRSYPKLENLKKQYGIQVTQDNLALVKHCDVVILSVKPQIMREVCTHLVEHMPEIKNKLIGSVAAGIPVATYQSLFGEQAKIIRIMPNTPALVSEAVSGLFASSSVSKSEQALMTEIFDSVGVSIWLEKETDIDVLGAVAGSGPAYFFEFMYGLQKAAEAHGFSAQTARLMVQQTALGAAKMAQQSERPLVELRQQVTSKGGSTAKGIEVYQAQQLDKTSEQAVQAAFNRNQEMAKLF